jgi:hypothetical protein
MGQSFTQIMAADRRNCINALMSEEDLARGEAVVYKEIMTAETPHVPPPAMYGEDMAELIADMMDYDGHRRP